MTKLFRRPLHRAAAAVLAALLLVGGIALFGADKGNPAHDVRLLSGAAWLSSAKVGQLTLLDGSSAEVVAQVQAAPAGSTLDVVQQGSTGYVIDQTAGAIRRVDGATFEMSRPEALIPDARTGLTALAGPDVLYAIDTQRGVLANADPRTLRKRGDPVPIAARLAANTAAVDDNGRLWVIDNGDLTSLTPGGGRSTTKIAPGGKAIVTIAGGRPVVMDTTGGKAITVDPDSGDADNEFDVELRDNDTVQISGSPRAERLYVVASRGVVIICDLTGAGCENAVPLSPGSKPGPAVEAGNRLFVPDHQTGQVLIIDLVTRQVVAKPQVLSPPGKFQLLARDGVVFYNDALSERAGVVQVDGTFTQARKYDVNDPGKGLTQPTNGEQNRDRPRQPDRPSDPDRPREPDRPQDPTAPSVQIMPSKLTVQIGEDVTMEVRSTNGPPPADAKWKFADGQEGEGTLVAHRWQAPGTYQVSVRATMPDERVAAASVAIKVITKPPVKLTVQITAPGGKVKGGGIDCPNVCSVDVDPDAPPITLAAWPDNKHTTGPWGPPCGHARPDCAVTMNGSGKTVTYQFVEKDDSLAMTMKRVGGGEIRIGSQTCTAAQCPFTVKPGVPVTISAMADGNSEFDRWTNGCANATAGSCQASWTTAGTVTATFKPITVQLLVSVTAESMNASVQIDAGTVCPVTPQKPHDECAFEVVTGATITLTGSTNQQAHFAWSGPCVADGRSCRNLVMDDNKTVTVNIVQD